MPRDTGIGGVGAASSHRARLRVLAGALVAVVAADCYRFGPAAPVPRWRPSLPAARTGSYRFEAPGGLGGEERFTVTSSAGVWSLLSVRRTPAGEEGFRLVVDRATAEPTAVEVWREVDGVGRRVRGRRADGVFVFEGTGMGGKARQEVAYAPGTWLDAPTPTFKAVPLALLATPLSEGARIPVRTIRLDGPLLRARVVLSTFQVRRRAGGQDLVRLQRPSGHPVGLWAAADGWPTRARVVAHDRRWEWTETRVRSATAAAGAEALR